MTDFSNFIFILLFLLSIFSYIVLNIYILSFLFVLGIALFVTYRGYIRRFLTGTGKQDRRNGMNQRRIEKMSGRRTTTGGHPLSPKPHKIHNTYHVSPNISSKTPLTPLHKSPWSSSSVLNDHLNDTSMIKKRSTWTSGKTTPSFLHNESNVSPWSNSMNQSHLINDKSDVASATLPAFLPMIKRALGLERLPEPHYSSPSRQAIVPIPNTGLSPGVYPNFRTRKQERLSLSERNTSMYRKTNTVKIAPPDPSRTLSPYLSRLKADSSMTEKSTPDTRAVVTALKERRKRSMNVQEETTPDVPIHHAKRRRQESQHSNASTSSLSSLHEALPDLSQHDYNIPRLETSTLKRPSRPSQDQNDDFESELNVKRPRQQTRNNAVWSSLSSSRKMVERREISGKDLAKRKLDLTDATDKENTETLSKFQRMDTVKLTPEMSFTKERSRMKPDRDSTKSPESSLNGSRVLKGVESEPSRPSMLTNLSSKKSSLSIYSEMNTRPKKVPYANVRATLEDYDKDKEAEHKRVQQMLQDVDEDYKEKSAADKVKSIIVTAVTSSFTTAPISTTTAYIPTSLNSSLGLKSTSQILTTCSEPITSSTVAPVPLQSLALPNGEIPKTPPKEVIPQQESGEGNNSINVTAPFSGFLSSNQTSQNRGETQIPVYSNSIQISLKAPDSQQSSVTASSSAATPGFNFAAGTTGMAVTSSSQPQFSFKPVFPLSATPTTTTASSGIAGFNFKFSGGSGAIATNSSGFSLPAGTTATNSSGFSLPAGTTATNSSGFSLPAGTTAINNSGFSFAAGTTVAAPSLKFSTINTSSNQAPILSTTESFPLLHKASSVPSSGTVFNFAANSSAPSSVTGGLNFTQPTSSAPASAGFNFNVNKTTASTVGGFTFGTNTTTSSTALGSFSFATNKTTSSANSGFVFSTNTTASNATGGFNFTPNSMASNTGISFKSPANTSVPSAASGFQSGNSLNFGQTNANLNFPSSMTSSGSAPVFNTGTFSFSSNTQSNTAGSATGDASNMSKFGAVSGTTDLKSGVGFNFSADAGKISFRTSQIGGGTNPFGQSGTVTQQATNAFGKNVTVNQQTSNLFGQNTTTSQQASNLFGQNTTTSQQASNLFGQNTTTSQQASNLFGQNTTTSQQASNLFGQNTTTSQQTSNLFGQNTTANQNVTSPFGQSGKTNQPVVNLFGQSTSANQQKPSLFGQTGPTNQQTSNMFGQSGIINQQTSNMFGQSGTANQQNPNLFGQSGTASQQTPNMFGQSASSNQQTSNPFVQNGSTFGTSLASSAPFVFGQGGSTQIDSGAPKGFNFSASSVATPQFNFNANSSFGTPGFGSPPPNPFTAGTNVFSVGSSSTAPRPRSVLKGKRRTGKK